MVLPIVNLDIYCRCNGRDTASPGIHIDGVTIYTLDTSRLIKFTSGKETVGAFKSIVRRSLVAWKDSCQVNSWQRSPVYDPVLAIPA